MLKKVLNSQKNFLYSCMLSLLNAEKAYFAMTYFFSKPYFSNKEGARSCYSLLSNEMSRVQQGLDRGEIQEQPPFVGFCRQVFHELLQITTLRSHLLDFYGSLQSIPDKMDYSFQDIIMVLTELKGKILNKLDTRPENSCMLVGVVKNIRKECDILEHLLCAQELTSNMHFLEPLVRIHKANQLLSKLAQCTTQTEVKLWTRPSYTSPVLVRWLQRLQAFVLDKYSLYFNAVLKKQSIIHPDGPSAMLLFGDAGSTQGTQSPSLISHPSTVSFFNSASSSGGLSLSPHCNPREFTMPATSWITKIQQYHKRHDVYQVVIMFDAMQQSFPYLRHGYVLPGLQGDPPTGINSFPIIYQYPQEPGVLLMDRVVMVTQISKNLTYGSQEEWKRILREVDNSQGQKLYYMSKVESRIFLISIFDASPNSDLGFGSGHHSCNAALAVFGNNAMAQHGLQTSGSFETSTLTVSSAGAGGGSHAVAVNSNTRSRLLALDGHVKKFHSEFAKDLRGIKVISCDLKE